MKPYEADLNTYNKAEFQTALEKIAKEKIATAKQTIFEYTRAKVRKGHQRAYEVVLEKEGETTIIKPAEGSEKLARVMEYGNSQHAPKMAWNVVFRKLRKLARISKTKPIILKKHFKFVITPKDLDI